MNKALILILLTGIAFFLARGSGTNISRALSILPGRSEPVVAKIHGRPVTLSQLERAFHEHLWLEGKNPASLTPADRKTARYAALLELIDHELLREKIRENPDRSAVSEIEIDARMRRMLGRFEHKAAFEAAMKAQGIPGEKALRDRLAARIEQENFIAAEIAPRIRISPEDASKWFAENREHLGFPERVEVRHLFVPTLDFPPEEAKQKLELALAALVAKQKDFATLAREISLDPATKDSGGSLGWMTRERLPADFAAPVFPLPLNQPKLIRTKLGWHLVEVTGRKPAAPRAFEHAEPEVIAALEAVKKREAIAAFRENLRREAAPDIEVFHDIIAK